MAHDASHVNHSDDKSSVKRIWFVFGILSVVTIAEVILGIIRPEFLEVTYVARMKLINWIFIILTIYKAYYITWAFMHMEHETKGLRRATVWSGVFLIAYLVFILLTEGDYIHDVYSTGYQTWDF